MEILLFMLPPAVCAIALVIWICVHAGSRKVMPPPPAKRDDAEEQGGSGIFFYSYTSFNGEETYQEQELSKTRLAQLQNRGDLD